MHKNLLLGLALAAFLVGQVAAQSSSRSSGSSSRSNNSSNTSAAAAMKKQKRLETRQQLKIAKKIQKDDFAGIKLDKAQKKALQDLVKTNYQNLTKFDMQIQQLIPGNKVKALQKAYRVSAKKVDDEGEAMMMSMKSVGIADQIQDQVMDLRDSKQVIFDEIRTEVAEMLSDDQREMMAAKAKSEMTEKEAMMEKSEEKTEMSTSSVSVTISLPGMT